MSSPIASLSMYDWPEVRPALQEFWTTVADCLGKQGIDAPSSLLHDPEDVMSMWTDPNLLVGQTCGWPYANKLRGKVTPFARFAYSLSDCPPGHYQSYFIGRKREDVEFLQSGDALANADAIAINGDDSQSGFHVFSEIAGVSAEDAISPTQRLMSGAHRNSIKEVSLGRAQLAAIDAIAFKMAERFDPDVVSNVCILKKSKPRPGLPLITSTKYSDKVNILMNSMHQAVNLKTNLLKEKLFIVDLIKAYDVDY